MNLLFGAKQTTMPPEKFDFQKALAFIKAHPESFASDELRQECKLFLVRKQLKAQKLQFDALARKFEKQINWEQAIMMKLENTELSAIDAKTISSAASRAFFVPNQDTAVSEAINALMIQAGERFLEASFATDAQWEISLRESI